MLFVEGGERTEVHHEGRGLHQGLLDRQGLLGSGAVMKSASKGEGMKPKDSF